MNKKMVAMLIVAMLTVNSMVYGATSMGVQMQSTTTGAIQVGSSVQNTEAETPKRVVTLDEAVELGLKNSIALQKIENQADLAKLVSDNAPETQITLNDGDTELTNAYYLIDDGRETLYNSITQLGSAEAALNNGIAPVDIPINEQITIPAGSDIKQYLIQMFNALYQGLPEEEIAQKVEVTYSQVMEKVQSQLDDNSSTLNSSKKKLEASTQEYLSSKSKYDAAVQFAMANVANKLSTSTISSLKTRPLSNLIVKMANIQDEVTSYSVNIYKNKIALLISNSYYEALKQQKLLEVKEKAAERGRVQYELAKAAYEVGAKSKDDMILAKSYYDSTIMNQELQLKDYNAAMIELKTNMNIDLGEEITLQEVELVTGVDYDLTQGINSGLNTRLEIKMAEAQKELYNQLMTAVKESDYTSSDNQYKEVKLLQEKANIELSGEKLQVESDIRTSYATITSMKKIAERASELRASAEETVEIAKVKYEVGFGYDNALLAQLNLESMSGTLVEVIAAEENLATIEEKQIEAINGYNLARLKYLNDIGILPYK